MIGLVFTFEGMGVQTSAPLAQALRVACAGERIAFEQVRAADVQVQVAVVFSALGQLDGFTARLSRVLPRGITIAALRAVRDDCAVNQDAFAAAGQLAT
jgi:hypothetical protein